MRLKQLQTVKRSGRKEINGPWGALALPPKEAKVGNFPGRNF